jgi:hypothetical protein
VIGVSAPLAHARFFGQLSTPTQMIESNCAEWVVSEVVKSHDAVRFDEFSPSLNAPSICIPVRQGLHASLNRQPTSEMF